MIPGTPELVVIVGRGRLGAALARAFERAEMAVVMLSHTERPPSRYRLGASALVILAVPDDAIRAVAEQVAGWRILPGLRVVHCSGSRTLSELQACVDVECRTAAMHPFQTIPQDAPLSVLNNVPWGTECLDDDVYWCTAVINMLRGMFVRLPANDARAKACYHAAAVASANLVQACLALAANACVSAGVDPAAMLPVITTAAVNNALNAIEHGRAIPFTGPVIRTDVTTIRRHVAALDIAEVWAYRHMTMAYVVLAVKTGAITQDAAASIYAVLDEARS